MLQITIVPLDVGIIMYLNHYPMLCVRIDHTVSIVPMNSIAR